MQINQILVSCRSFEGGKRVAGVSSSTKTTLFHLKIFMLRTQLLRSRKIPLCCSRMRLGILLLLQVDSAGYVQIREAHSVSKDPTMDATLCQLLQQKPWLCVQAFRRLCPLELKTWSISQTLKVLSI